MSATIIIIGITAAAMILLSSSAVVGNAFAITQGKEENLSGGGDTSSLHQPQQVGKIPDYSRCPSGSSCAVKAPDNSGSSNNNNGGSSGDGSGHHSHHHKSHAIGSGSGSVSTTLGGDSSSAITIPGVSEQNGGLLNLQVSNVKVFKNFTMNSYDVVGKVSNNDTINTLQTITVNVQFFDNQDTLLGENSDGTDSLAPGQTWSFKVSGFPEILENQPITAVDHYQITATGFKPP